MTVVWALLQVIGFFGGIFICIFFLVTGVHSTVSKKPAKVNLHPKTLEKRFKNALVLTVLLMVIEHYLNKFRDWWHGKG